MSINSKPREEDLALLRLGLKHKIPLSICYLDESGKREEGEEGEELTPLREENELSDLQKRGRGFNHKDPDSMDRRGSTPFRGTRRERGTTPSLEKRSPGQ